MIQKIKQLLGVCDHKWEVIETVSFRSYKWFGFSDVQTVKYHYHQKCKQCGKLKKTIL